MTLVAEWRGSSRPTDLASILFRVLPPRVLGGGALACLAGVCAFAICAQLDGLTRTSPRADASAPRGDRMVAARGDMLQRPAAGTPPVSTTAFDQRFAGAPRELAEGAIPIPPLGQASAPAQPQPERHFALHSPAPAHGPATRLRSGWHPDGARSDEQAASNPDKGIFTKLFGRPHPTIFTKLFGQPSSNVKLAYASTEGGVADSGGITSGLFDRQTAVYDISAHMVYLPDGRKLEAHSGLGSLLDDPESAHTRMRGVTPPDIYDLKPREALFHGVAALRLLPEDQAKVFGRAGLLAHSFMLGPNGQSNGCVSFRNYDAFRKAYDDHEITRLAVVSRID